MSSRAEVLERATPGVASGSALESGELLCTERVWVRGIVQVSGWGDHGVRTLGAVRAPCCAPSEQRGRGLLCCVARRTHVREARDARGARIVERSLWKAEIVIWSSVLRDRNLELGTAREICNDIIKIIMIS